MTTATIEELAYLMRQAKEEGLPQPIVFLGAGASKSGGVPLASEIIEDILEKYKDSPKIKALVDEPKNYARLMECLTPFERNKLLKGYIDNAKINVTHLYLAQLLIEGYIDYVLTVNFDNLMLRALALFNNFPATYDMAILKDLTTTSFKEKSVVYLHGQHHGLWLLNTTEEMTKVNEVIPPILNGIKNQRPWIFIGYSGEDPIFKHIIKLGRFDNGLYWITYNDSPPSKLVCETLLEQPNTNTHIIKGFDSDSFVLKLNAELSLSQPTIIDKPFSSLNKTLQNIVDIDDKEHFKGVKERLEIAKNNVGNAITQFEKGKIKLDKKFQDEINISLLKKQIIDIIISNTFNEIEIDTLEETARKIKKEEINKLLATLYLNWGNSISEATVKKNQDIHRKSIEKYKKASVLNPLDSGIFNNWGISIKEIAKEEKNEKLFYESIEKYKTAISLNPNSVEAYNNWGGAMCELYNLNKNPNLIEETIEKFKRAHEINPKFVNTYINWGSFLINVSQQNFNEELLNESIILQKKAIELAPTDSVAYCNLGSALKILGDIKKDKSYYIKSIEKYKEAIELEKHEALYYKNLSVSYRALALYEKDEKLFKEGIDIIKIANELDPNNSEIYYDWGSIVFDLYKLTKSKDLCHEALKLLEKGIELGGKSYNLSCVYSYENDKINALKYLKISLERGEITIEFVKNDSDWSNFFNDTDFNNLLQEYLNKN